MEDGTIWIFMAMVFAAVFFLAQGMSVPVFGESRRVRLRLSERLSEIDTASDEESINSLLREKYLQNLSPMEQQLESIPAMEDLRKLIEQAGHNILAYKLVLLSVLLAVVAGVITWVLTRMPEAAAFAAFVGLVAPIMKVRVDRSKRISQFEEQLPDAIDVMRRALQAGHPFNGAVKLVAEDMEEPVAGEFKLLFADINYGNNVRRAMLGLMGRVPSVTVMALVTAVLVQKETGGNLAEILRQISEVIRGRFKLYRKVRTLSAEGRMSAWVLALVPLILFATLTFSNPDYLPRLFDSELGRQIALGTFVWAGIGILFLRKIIRIDV